MNQCTTKDVLEAFQALTTAVGIIVAGIWTYYAFVRNRLKYPQVEIKHRVSHAWTENGKLLLQVVITINNTGNVLVPMTSLQTSIQQMLPLPIDLKSRLASSRRKMQI